MEYSADSPQTRLATRLAFFAAGFALACWAPLVPFAKANVGVEDGALGLLLLCLGVGSTVAMPLTGWFAARIGSKPMIVGGGLGMVLMLPLLALAADPLMLGLVLLVFGASLGTIDVAMNVHALEVEAAARRPLMSGFHGMFSVGGIVGAGGITFLLSAGVTPFDSALAGSVLAFAAILVAWPRLLKARGGEPMQSVAPRGIVLLLALLSGITFLVEGVVLDWGALLVVGKGLVEAAQGGLGYMLFAVAMTIGRLTGDRIVAAVGDRKILLYGGLLTIAGFVVLLVSPWPLIAMSGFVLIGFGASNIVPVLFSLSGRQSIMPPGLAIASVTTAGYAGILVGPAAVGFASHLTNLEVAFWMIVLLMALVPLFARTAAGK